MTDSRRDLRKWHISKEVPLSLLYAFGVLVIGGFMGYQSLQDKVEKQGDGQASLVAALRDTNDQLRGLAKQFQEGSIPSAQNAWRIQQNETAVAKLDQRLSDVERAAQAREARVQRLESMLSSTNARVRAQGER